MLKKFLYLVLIMGLIVNLSAGCGNNKNSNMKKKPSQIMRLQTGKTKVPKPVQITFAHCQGEWAWSILEQLGKNYTMKTGNTVKFLNIPADGFDKWQQAQMIAGTEPDIIFGVSKAEDFYKRGKIVDMTSYLNDMSPYTEKAWKTSFLDGILAGVLDKTTGKASIGVPLLLVTVNLYYNRDVFRSLNIPDNTPQTWGQVLDIAKIVKASGKDIVPFSVMNGMNWNLGWMSGKFLEDLWINSGIVKKLDIMNPNGKLDISEIVLGIKTGVIDPADPRFVDYFRYMKQLSTYFNKGYNSMFFEYETLFNDGKAAMQLNGSWYPSQHMTDNFPVNYGIAPLPYVDSSVSKYSRNKQIKYVIGPGNPDLLVTTRAKKEGRADMAVDFLRYLTDPQTGAKYFINKTMFLPVVKGVEVPAQIKDIINMNGTETVKTNMNLILSITNEEDKQYQDMFKVFLEEKSNPEEFVKIFKTLVLKAANQYIAEKPEMRVQDFIDKVKK